MAVCKRGPNSPSGAMGPYSSSRLTSVGSWDMWSQIFRWATVCHAWILDNATVVAVVRVRMAVIALPISVASSGGSASGLVAMAETAEASKAMLFCAAKPWAAHW